MDALSLKPDQRLRLRCLELVLHQLPHFQEKDRHSVTEWADRFYDYVMEGSTSRSEQQRKPVLKEV